MYGFLSLSIFILADKTPMKIDLQYKFLYCENAIYGK